ncbi:MAG: hypothetical protein V2G41_09275 [bacterium JZ-2024 1]
MPEIVTYGTIFDGANHEGSDSSPLQSTEYQDLETVEMHQPIDAVLIPTYERPEFLAITLDLLSKARGIDQCDIYLSIDDHPWQHPHPDIVTVAKSSGLPVKIIQQPPSPYRGNSQNVLRMLMSLATRGYRYIFYVEEDVFVARDFFDWHKKIHESGNFFASIAVRNQNEGAPAIEPNPELAYVSTTDYSALGVCFPSSSISWISPHVREEYFSAMADYVVRKFPNSRFSSTWSEQDGLIRRIIEANNLVVVWPAVPRAFHAGYYGYNRGGCPPALSLGDRIADLRRIMFDGDELNRRSPLYKDIIPCSLDGYFVQRPRIIQ